MNSPLNIKESRNFYVLNFLLFLFSEIVFV